MEDHAEDPARQAEIAEHDVVFPQGISRGDLGADLGETVVVGEEIEEGEEDRGRFLHAEEAVKRPFAVVLDDGFEIWGIAGESGRGGDVLADVVAFRGAGPEEESMLEGWLNISVGGLIGIRGG